MSSYQVIARRYRPQTFAEIIGQDPIVKTLKNGIKSKRLAHAFLFCGSRGTGKTTLARVLAKALNCENPQADFEPCNHCRSCKEITSGQSLDVLEIDGASHRGIDDIRQINDTVGYASSGHYKIYIIDEVHMLTKEAFNALLKTLEEPPSNVKFFFATTEPHKVLPTILSRCQRFNLNRIPLESIIGKLRAIAQDLKVEAEEEALHLIAKCADGGLRDAESLLDQILVFNDEQITVDTVSSVLGIVANDILFELDRAGKEGRFAFAFDVAHQVFSQGKDLLHFVESLVEHFRNLIVIKLSGREAPFLLLSETALEKYLQSAQAYTKEQCLHVLEYLVEEQNKVRFMPSPRIALEAILLHIMRVHQRLPIEFLVRRLTELENKIQEAGSKQPPPAEIKKPITETPPAEAKKPITETPQAEAKKPITETAPAEAKKPLIETASAEAKKPLTETAPAEAKKPFIETPPAEAKKPISETPPAEAKNPFIEIPPTEAKKPLIETASAEIKKPLIETPTTETAIVEKTPIIETVIAPTQPKKSTKAKPKTKDADPVPTPEELGVKVTTPNKETKKGVKITADKQSRYDTLMHFAAVELEGTVQKG